MPLRNDLLRRARVLFWASSVILLGLLLFKSAARAQETAPEAPIYRVQSGDSLWSIALRFGVDVDELAAFNGIHDPALLHVGQELVIPGLTGFSGYLETQAVPLGETARSLRRKYGLPRDAFLRLNRLTSPMELYAGDFLILPEREADSLLGRRVALGEGEPSLRAAGLLGINPWVLALRNGVASPALILSRDVLLLPGEEDGPGALPPSVAAFEVNAPLIQGSTAVIRLKTAAEAEGTFAGHTLHFFPDGEGGLTALQGIHALLEPGVYPLKVHLRLAGGGGFAFEQSVPVYEGDYPYDPPIYVPPETLDPAITEPENEELFALTEPVTPQKRWRGGFVSPVDAAYFECWPSRYGDRRSYNDSGYIYFHTGLDFCGQVGHDIYAAADGVVVFAGETTVRGNMTVIDHGWGVYTVYLHQSEMFVQPGDAVQAGQLIGLVGNTGRVTGPHLHFEVWVNGVQVDPWPWLTNVYP